MFLNRFLTGANVLLNFALLFIANDTSNVFTELCRLPSINCPFTPPQVSWNCSLNCMCTIGLQMLPVLLMDWAPIALDCIQDLYLSFHCQTFLYLRYPSVFNFLLETRRNSECNSLYLLYLYDYPTVIQRLKSQRDMEMSTSIICQEMRSLSAPILLNTLLIIQTSPPPDFIISYIDFSVSLRGSTELVKWWPLRHKSL